MYFKKIYMHGFKSFADPVTIEFHKGITCIVGPNGSGKEQYFRCHQMGAGRTESKDASRRQNGRGHILRNSKPQIQRHGGGNTDDRQLEAIYFP